MDQQFPEQIYYMVVDEKSTGPYTLEQVINHPALMPHTLVWKPGIDNWVAAQTLPEFADIFVQKEEPNHQTPPDFNQSAYQERSNYNPNYQSNQPPYNNSSQGRNNYDPHYNQNSNPYNQFANNPQYRSDHTYNHHNQRYYQNPYNRYNNGYRPDFRTNWLPWAIVATIVGFFTSCIGAIFGIIGIVQANKANNLYAQGFDPEADSANQNAKTMTIIGLILAGIGLLIWLWVGNVSIFSSAF